MNAAGKIPRNGGPIGRAITAHQAEFPDPLAFAAGDVLAAEDRKTAWDGWIWCVNEKGKGGWVPEDYVDRQGDTCTALREYDSAELSVDAGDILEVGEEVGGWLWCVNEEGKGGWIPTACVEPYEED